MHKLKRVPSGIEGLDRVLKGGFIEGAAYIIQGLPGAGKTILSNQIAFSHTANGGKVLYVTLLAETHERLFQALATLSFYDAEKVGQDIVYISVFKALRDDGLDAIVQLLRSETKRHGATLLVFDGLLNARHRADTDLDVKTFVAEIQSQAAFVGCTVLFLTSTPLDDSSPEHTMVDGVIDLSDELFGLRTIRQLQVRKSRASASLNGLHQFEISDKGITVYPRMARASNLQPQASVPAFSRVSLGTAGLDELVLGGVPSGSVTLVGGPAGSGKTTLGLHFLSKGNAAEPALHFGFYETPARLRRKAQELNISLPSDSSFGIIWNPISENLLDKLGHQLLEEVRGKNVRRLFIDGLGGFEQSAGMPTRLAQFFYVLTNQLREMGVTTILTLECEEVLSAPSRLPPHPTSALIDNMILLGLTQNQCGLQRHIAVRKMRDSAFIPTPCEFDLTDQGLVVGKPLASSIEDVANRDVS